MHNCENRCLLYAVMSRKSWSLEERNYSRKGSTIFSCDSVWTFFLPSGPKVPWHKFLNVCERKKTTLDTSDLL